MQTTNLILDSHHALIDGKKTALAGCASKESCERRGYCLRADERLAYLAELRRADIPCSYFIGLVAA